MGLPPVALEAVAARDLAPLFLSLRCEEPPGMARPGVGKRFLAFAAVSLLASHGVLGQVALRGWSAAHVDSEWNRGPYVQVSTSGSQA